MGLFCHAWLFFPSSSCSMWLLTPSLLAVNCLSCSPSGGPGPPSFPPPLVDPISLRYQAMPHSSVGHLCLLSLARLLSLTGLPHWPWGAGSVAVPHLHGCAWFWSPGSESSYEICITNTIINIIWYKIKIFKHFVIFQKICFLKGQPSENLVPFFYIYG